MALQSAYKPVKRADLSPSTFSLMYPPDKILIDLNNTTRRETPFEKNRALVKVAALASAILEGG